MSRAYEKVSSTVDLTAGLCFLAAAMVFFLAVNAAQATQAEEPVIVLHTHDEEVGADVLRENPAVETVRCIFRRLDRKVDIRKAPRLRNRGLLESGRIDGMFPNLSDPDLDLIAEATDPFVLERWSYVKLASYAGGDRPDKETVGVVLGSNESRFLAQQGVPMFDAVPNTEFLVRLLASGRLSYVMVDDWSFDAEASLLGYPADRFQSTILRYLPLQLHFSKPFARANPGLVSLFNVTVDDCVHQGRVVAEWEQDVLRAEAEKVLENHKAAIDRYLADANTLDGLDPFLPRGEAFSGVDEAWRDALDQNRPTDFMETMLGNPLSQFLRVIAAEHPSVTEIFVMNDDGFIIGLNQMTSDFWQGDEDAAAAVLKGGAEHHFF